MHQPLTLPQVNLNGTSRRALVEQLCNVTDSLRETIARMCEARPHGRDYQLDALQYPAAFNAWEERILAVQAMLEEIEAHALRINDGA